jgi:YD repeat-containing protein
MILSKGNCDLRTPSRLLKGLARALAALLLIQVLPGGGAHAQDLRIGYPQQFTISPKGVNLQTGQFTYQQVDLAVGPLKFTRMFGTGGSNTVSGFGVPMSGGGSLSNGWAHNFTSNIWIDNSTSTPFYHVTVDGTQYTFKYSGGTSMAPADGPALNARLVASGSIQAGGTTNGQWVMSDGSGNQYTFSGPGYVVPLQSMLYANGSAVTLTYNAGGQPKLISSSLGYAIVLDYNGNQTISAACGYNTALTYVNSSTTCSGSPLVKVSYGYDSAPRLTSVTDVRLGVTTIKYSVTYGMTELSCITLVNSQSCAIQNTYSGSSGYADAVTSQTTAKGNLWQYTYTPPPNPADVPQAPCSPYWSQGSMIDAAGRGTSAYYDRGYLVQLYAPDGEYDYLYPNGCATYGSSGIAPVSVETRLTIPAFVRKPGGVREYYDFDNLGRITKKAVLPIGGPDPSGLISSDPTLARCCTNIMSFSPPTGSLIYQTNYVPWATAGCANVSDAKLCDKPISVIDPNGNETDYTYDPAHGGLLTETLPAQPNGVRPQTRYSYVQRQAWLKTSGGGYVGTGQYVWLLASKSLCKTSAWTGTACAAGSSDLVTTTYDYGPDSGPNNLLLRGVVEDSGTGTLNLRTCYTYDAQGNKLSETKPLGTAGSCP